MAFEDKIITSVHGRRLGLQRVTTALSGGTLGDHEFLVGSFDGQRLNATTADTTAASLTPFGMHTLNVSSVASSQVYFVDPPIPGTGPLWVMPVATDFAYLRIASSALGAAPVVQTSAGSTFTTIKLSTLGFGLQLVPMTTALWLAVGGSTATGHSYTTST